MEHWRNFLIIAGLFAFIIVLVSSDFGQPTGRVYDCNMAQWHPDIPQFVREECRRLIQEEFERQRREELNKKLIRT